MFLLFISFCCSNMNAQAITGKWGRMKELFKSNGLGHGDEIMEFNKR